VSEKYLKADEMPNRSRQGGTKLSDVLTVLATLRASAQENRKSLAKASCAQRQRSMGRFGTQLL